MQHGAKIKPLFLSVLVIIGVIMHLHTVRTRHFQPHGDDC